MTLEEALNSSSERREGSVIPNPPSLAANAISFLTVLFGGERPVMDGIKLERMVSSNAYFISFVNVYAHFLSSAL